MRPTRDVLRLLAGGVVAAAFLAAAGCSDSPAQPVAERFAATLGPAPGVTTSASGSATVAATAVGVSFSITTTGISDGVSARIVDATNDETLVVLSLQPGGAGQGTATYTNQNTLPRLRAGQAYLLVTTESNPTGELLGTLLPQ